MGVQACTPHAVAFQQGRTKHQALLRHGHAMVRHCHASKGLWIACKQRLAWGPHLLRAGERRGEREREGLRRRRSALRLRLRRR